MTATAPIEITLQASDYAQLDQLARNEFGAPMRPDTLSHEHALRLVAALLHAIARTDEVQCSANGRVVASAALDGAAAAQGAVEQVARWLDPVIDDDRPLIVRIAPTTWQRLTGRAPQTMQWQARR